jgi:hypothetical protein
LDPRSELLGFHMPGPASVCHIKRHGGGRQRRFITWPRKTQRKHSAHLQLSSGYTHELWV